MSEWDRTWDDWVISNLHERDETWAEHLDHRDQERRDREIRMESSLHQGCVVCMERDGKGVYGGKCRRCFDAQREERDAA